MILPYSFYKYFLKNTFLYKLLVAIALFIFLNSSSPASSSFWIQFAFFALCFMIFLAHYNTLTSYRLKKMFDVDKVELALIYIHSSLVFFTLLIFKPFLIYNPLLKYLIFGIVFILFLHFTTKKIKRRFSINPYFTYSIFIQSYILLFILPLIIVIGIFSLL